MYRTAYSKKNKAGATGLIDHDMRGKHLNRPHRYPGEVLNLIRAHIKSFPSVELRYCCESTNKEYFLESGLNLSKMCRMLNDIVKAKDVNIDISLNEYREIFDEDFNIGFLSPLKYK